MTFVRVGLLNGIAVGIRMLSALVLNKVLAISVGPSGFALIGQLQNVVNILNTFAAVSTSQGITKYTAEHQDEPQRLHAFWQTAGSVVFLTAVTTSALTIVLSPWLAGYFLHDSTLYSVFVLLGVGLILLSLNAFLIAILTGLKDVRTYVISNISGSLLGLALIVGLTLIGGIRGALAALAVNQSLAIGVTVWLCRGRPWFKLRLLIGRFDRRVIVALSGFIAMAAASAIAGSLAQIAVRSHLIAVFGKVRAGEWEAMMRISSLYLLFFTSTLAIYYLPRVSAIRRSADLTAEVLRMCRHMLPVVAAGSLLLFLLRDVIIRLLFDPSFYGMRDLFAWQMAGDTCKALGWIFSYTMIGRAMAGWYIGSEIGFNLAWVAISFAGVAGFGFVGIGVAYAASYLLYLISIAGIFFYSTRAMRASEIDAARAGVPQLPVEVPL